MTDALIHTDFPTATEPLADLEPSAVFRAFAAISCIPRGSGKEAAVSAYLLNFARRLNLEVRQDPALNIIIKKQGSPGYEMAPTVILQGHMDMVWEKSDASPHNFETDPIKLKVSGDRLSADGTTLGADNGIALAYAMALLASKDLLHPPLEILMTTQEEIGLKGAALVDPSSLSGKILINLDAEEEGRFFVSCSGGARCTLSLPLEYASAPGGYEGLDLKIFGLKGGHSGLDIQLGRANANALMGRLLKALSGLDFFLISIAGGTMVNAIPRTAEARIFVRQEHAGQAGERVRGMEMALSREFGQTDTGLRISCTSVKVEIPRVISQGSGLKIIELLGKIPTGVQSMSPDIKGLVESSLNFGIMAIQEDSLECQCSARSCSDQLRDALCTRLENIAGSAGAGVVAGATYPAWEYRKESYIRPLMERVYQDRYGKSPEICAMHAGLECGILGHVLREMDMISMGPDIFHVHTPEECLSIASVKRTWELLCHVLKSIR